MILTTFVQNLKTSMNNASIKINTSRKWRIVYTKSKWEKRSDLLLKRRGLNSFCPLIKTKRNWADRMKIVEMPLFSSYLFVYVNPLEEQQVLHVDGIISYVRDFGKHAELSKEEIENIGNLVNTYEDLECISIPNLQKGDKVSVDDGILFDLKGEVTEVRGKQVVMLMKSLDCGLIAKITVNSDALLVTRTKDINFN